MDLHVRVYRWTDGSLPVDAVVAFNPTQPLASTREHAVVGVAGIAPIPNQLIRFTPDFLVAPNEPLRGVGVTPGPGLAKASTFGVIVVSVRVEGVHVVWLRSGGNTNNVCWGAELEGTMVTLVGGVTGNRRGAGRARAVFGVARVGTATGEDGTVGRGVGRLVDECDLIEDARDPGAGNEKPALVAGAEGGAGPRGPSLRSDGGGGITPNEVRVAVCGGTPKDILNAGADGGGGS